MVIPNLFLFTLVIAKYKAVCIGDIAYIVVIMVMLVELKTVIGGCVIAERPSVY